MKTLTEVRQLLVRHKQRLQRRYHLEAIGIFGSFSRGEQTSRSDIDIFVRFREGATLFDYVALAQELESLLQVRVDLVSEGGIRKELKDRIAKEVLMA